MLDIVAEGHAAFLVIANLHHRPQAVLRGGIIPFAENHRLAAAPLVDLLQEWLFDDISVVIDADHIDIFATDLDGVLVVRRARCPAAADEKVIRVGLLENPPDHGVIGFQIELIKRLHVRIAGIGADEQRRFIQCLEIGERNGGIPSRVELSDLLILLPQHSHQSTFGRDLARLISGNQFG